jgi:hypothetical protein
MRNHWQDFKRIAALLVTGFFIFAPPGTLIVIALFVFGLTGKIGVIVVSILAVAILIWMFGVKRLVAAFESKAMTGRRTSKRLSDHDSV